MSKYIVGVFNDDDVLLTAIKNIRANGIRIDDVLTPFPIHGMEDALDQPHSRIPTAGFIFGACGTLTALGGMTYIAAIDWKINVGGKPFWALPSFIPITFELTVLFSAIGMVLVFLLSSWLIPGATNTILDERITDDKFVLAFDISSKSNAEKSGRIRELLQQYGASEVNEKVI